MIANEESKSALYNKHGHELLRIEWFTLRHRLTGSDGTLQS